MLFLLEIIQCDNDSTLKDLFKKSNALYYYSEFLNIINNYLHYVEPSALNLFG